MNAKISVFVICVEVTVYLLLYNLHDFTFKISPVLNFRPYHVRSLHEQKKHISMCPLLVSLLVKIQIQDFSK